MGTLLQDDGKRRSLRRACARTNPNRAAVLFDDLLTDPQAQAISCQTFRREKRLKYPRKRRRPDTLAIIGDSNPNA
jgi:hypothetical protein